MIWMSSICAGILCAAVYTKVSGQRPAHSVLYVLWCGIWEMAIHSLLSSQTAALLFPLFSALLFWKMSLSDKVMFSLMVFSLLFLSHLAAVLTGRLADNEAPLFLFGITWAAAGILTFLYLLFLKYASRFHSSWWVMLAAVPAALILVTADSHALFYTRFGIESLIILTLVILLTVGCMQLMETQRKREKEKLLVQARNEELASRYDLLQLQYLTGFKALHDTLHHCQSVDESLKSGDIEEARKKLAGFAQQITESFHEQYTTSPVMNALLLKRKEQLQKENIHIHVQWDNAAASHISLMTLTDLMNLLLDAAIEQCRFSERKTIMIKLGIHNDRKILTVQCPADDHSSFEATLPFIRKHCPETTIRKTCDTLTFILGLDSVSEKQKV